MLKEGVSIIEYINRCICDKCCFYKTNKCNPDINHSTPNYDGNKPDKSHYEINCFRIEVRNEMEDDKC